MCRVNGFHPAFHVSNIRFQKGTTRRPRGTHFLSSPSQISVHMVLFILTLLSEAYLPPTDNISVSPDVQTDSENEAQEFGWDHNDRNIPNT
ncbi:unnamed protein product [Fusarium venenatum]|uniref:Uncharacterized protein n=1 Tax=Fusarium venenatum TaxID=56646 RepID=A0A2L2T6U3_9HYPO|nr:uncharacterized protein FVRRES_03044 [Fusarium venenatum]CEI66532.1 unnamed protein product [Fusarium venenatum]